MGLKSLLSEKKGSILKRWFDVIVEACPSGTINFLKEQKNRFANPVGYTISHGMDGLFEGLLQGMDSEVSAQAGLFLDNIMKIRAVQDFSPSQAIGFIFLLKKVIREKLAREIQKDGLFEELLALESRIDGLALLSFDIYMKCREKIYEIKANEVRNSVFKLLQRANLIYEIPEKEPRLKDGDTDNPT